MQKMYSDLSINILIKVRIFKKRQWGRDSNKGVRKRLEQVLLSFRKKVQDSFRIQPEFTTPPSFKMHRHMHTNICL